MKAKIWIIGWLLIVGGVLGTLAFGVYKVDPFFHFHEPRTDMYYYCLDNQRSQNNGISKNFKYNAIITGTSMTENFQTSEFDALFGVDSIKVAYSGATFKEINDNLEVALKNNKEVRIIVRCLDTSMMLCEADKLRDDQGEYPLYLYDDNPFNDIKYLLNRDVIWGRVLPMVAENNMPGFVPGITSFDDYSRWQYGYTFGIKTVCPKGVEYSGLGDMICLTEEERSIIQKNITKNVTELADKYPDVKFYYFFPPYSAIWWKYHAENGTLVKQLEVEQTAIELILEHENIKLFSFNERTDITTDLNNYKDDSHYGQWINSCILRWMYNDKYQLTKDNYLEYLDYLLEFYTSFDYESMNKQDDYEDDYYIIELLEGE